MTPDCYFFDKTKLKTNRKFLNLKIVHEVQSGSKCGKANVRKPPKFLPWFHHVLCTLSWCLLRVNNIKVMFQAHLVSLNITELFSSSTLIREGKVLVPCFDLPSSIFLPLILCIWFCDWLFLLFILLLSRTKPRGKGI